MACSGRALGVVRSSRYTQLSVPKSWMTCGVKEWRCSRGWPGVMDLAS